MAELMMFQPGTAFMDSYNKAKAGSLAKIAFTEPQRRQSALADLYGLDPQAANSMKKEFDAQEQEQLKLVSTAFVGADDNQRNQMWPGIKAKWRPRFQALGSDIPDDWKQALPTIQALAGVGMQQGQPAKVQEAQWFAKEAGFDPQKDPKGYTDFIRRYSGAGGNYTLSDDPATGKKYRFNNKTGQFEPVDSVAGDVPQAEQDPMQPYLDRIKMGAEVLAQNGFSVQQINAWKENEFAEAQKKVAETGVTFTQTYQPQPSGYRGMSAAEIARAEAEAKAQVELQYAPQVEGAKARSKADVEIQTAPQIEGAKAAAVETAKRAAINVADAPKFITTADQTLAVIDKAINHPGRAGATGMSAALPWQYAYGTKERDFITVSQQLEGKTFLQAFESLKGGGAITEMEGQAATKAIARLDRAQTEGEYLAALNELRQIVVDARNRAVQAMRGNRAPAPTGNQPSSGKRVGRFVIEEN